MRIGNARNGGDPSAQLPGDPQVLGAVVADGAHVDLRRNAEIENLRHHVGGLEVEDRLREGAGSTWRSLRCSSRSADGLP